MKKALLVFPLAVLLAGCGYADSLMLGARPTPSASATGNGECVINVLLAPDLYEEYIRNVNPEAERLRGALREMQKATGVYCTINAGQGGQFDPQRIVVSLHYKVMNP